MRSAIIAGRYGNGARGRRPEGETARLAFRIRRKTQRTEPYFVFEVLPAPFAALVVVIFVATI